MTALTNLNQLSSAYKWKSLALEEAMFRFCYFGCWIYSDWDYSIDAYWSFQVVTIKHNVYDYYSFSSQHLVIHTDFNGWL